MPVEVYRIFPWPSFVPAVGLKRPICSGSKIKKCEWVTSLCNDSVLQTLDIFTLSIVTMQLKGERTRDRMQQINTPTHPRKIGTRNPAQLLEPDQKCWYPMLNANNLRTVLHSSGKKKNLSCILILLHLWKKLNLGTHYAKKLFIRTAPRPSRFLTWFLKNPVLFSFAFSLLSARAVNYLMSWLGCI